MPRAPRLARILPLAILAPMETNVNDATTFRRAIRFPRCPPLDSGLWLDVDLTIRDRIRRDHPDLSDDEIWDHIERG